LKSDAITFVFKIAHHGILQGLKEEVMASLASKSIFEIETIRVILFDHA
jgi:hypothetical protein